VCGWMCVGVCVGVDNSEDRLMYLLSTITDVSGVCRCRCMCVWVCRCRYVCVGGCVCR